MLGKVLSLRSTLVLASTIRTDCRRLLTRREESLTLSALTQARRAFHHQLHQHKRRRSHHHLYNDEDAAVGTKIPRRAALLRFLDPWYDLAECTQQSVLSDRVETVTRTFGVVAALMTSLSAALLALAPERQDTTTGDSDVSRKGKVQNATIQTTNPASPRMPSNLLQHIFTTRHPPGTSLLVSWGYAPSVIDDWYAGTCAAAFYGGFGAMGLSAVLNAWLAATPPTFVKAFVQLHSKLIVCIPGLLGVSTLMAGSALFLGLDRTKGTPISYIGLAGTGLGGALIGMASMKGWISTFRFLTLLVKK